MMNILTLKEYEDWQGALDTQDALYLKSQFQPMLKIHQLFQANYWHIRTKQYIGIIGLPSGARLEILPKVPIATIFAMLAITYDLPNEFRDELVGCTQFEEIFSIIANYFVDLVQAQIDHGLYRTYIELEDNLPMVRGRIDFNADMHNNTVLRNQIACRFSELTWDIPENQIIRQVLHFLGGWDFPTSLRSCLHNADHMLSEITRTYYSVGSLEKIHYHRQNETYLPIHQLCKLFLEGTSLAESAGEVLFPSFLIDMNHLFEQFITCVLQNHLPLTDTIRAQQSLWLDNSKIIAIRPDCLISRQGRLLLVADCKYKRDIIPSPEDCYQLLAYCTALDCSHGVLIYPHTTGFQSYKIPIANSQVTIYTTSIDLNGSGSALVESCHTFIYTIDSILDK